MEANAQNGSENGARQDVNLKTFVVEEIRKKIMTGQYALGQRLSQSSLALEMRTSRAPVQDALIALSHEGLVEILPQKGSFVFNPTEEEVLALYELNSILEVGALRLAIERNAKELISQLEESLALMQASEDCPQEWVMADRSFHKHFIKAAGNPYLVKAYHRAIICTTPLVFKNTVNTERMRASYAEHFEIIEFLKEGNTEKAIEVLRKNNKITAEFFV